MKTRHPGRKGKRSAITTDYAKTKTQKTARPLLASSKLSDYHILKILRLFADGASPAETARQVRVSYITIQRIFDMVRRRLLLLGFYTPFEQFIAGMDAREELIGYWDKEEFLAYIDRKLRERRGVTKDTLPLHRAELSYRFIEHELAEPGSKPSDFSEIVMLLRMSGPINRPPDNYRMLYALMYALDRIEDSHRRLDREIRVMQSRL